MFVKDSLPCTIDQQAGEVCKIMFLISLVYQHKNEEESLVGVALYQALVSDSCARTSGS